MEAPEVFDEQGFRLWPDGHRSWPGPGPQPDRKGMTLDQAREVLDGGPR